VSRLYAHDIQSEDHNADNPRDQATQKWHVQDDCVENYKRQYNALIKPERNSHMVRKMRGGNRGILHDGKPMVV